MGFMDELMGKAQGKLDTMNVRPQVQNLMYQLGYLLYQQQTGRSAADATTQLQVAVARLQQLESTNPEAFVPPVSMTSGIPTGQAVGGGAMTTSAVPQPQPAGYGQPAGYAQTPTAYLQPGVGYPQAGGSMIPAAGGSMIPTGRTGVTTPPVPVTAPAIPTNRVYTPGVPAAAGLYPPGVFALDALGYPTHDEGESGWPLSAEDPHLPLGPEDLAQMGVVYPSPQDQRFWAGGMGLPPGFAEFAQQQSNLAPPAPPMAAP
jgi:hypothetical protein